MDADSTSGLVITLPGGSLDLLRRRVLRHGESAEVESRAWRVLEHLARLRHRVVTKEELLTALRPKGTVSDGALRQAVRAARRAIGDDGDPPIIRSVPRVGHCNVGRIDMRRWSWIRRGKLPPASPRISSSRDWRVGC